MVLRELDELGLDIVVAHFNHNIRGDESRRDAEFVRALAARLSLPFELGEADVPAVAASRGGSLEERAREERYAFLRRVRSRLGARAVVTGHTLDDQAETVVMRLLRGSGPRGLGGIPPVGEGGGVVRPLIEAPREAVRDYLARRGETWVEDSSNVDPSHLRNRIRAELMPALEAFNPSVREALHRVAAIARAYADFVEGEAEAACGGVFPACPGLERSTGLVVGRCAPYAALPAALRYELVRLARRRVQGDLRRLAAEHVLAVDALLTGPQPSGEVPLPGGWTVAKGYGLFALCSPASAVAEYRRTIAGPGRWRFPELECEVAYEDVPRPAADPDTAVLDPSALGFPLEVRNYGPTLGGATFAPLGMKGRKRLKKLFIDEKVPRFLRPHVPLFIHGDEIVWVGGVRVSEKARYRGGEGLVIRLVAPRVGRLLRLAAA